MPTGIDIFIVTNKAGASSSVGVSHDKTRLYVPVTLITSQISWIISKAKRDGEPLIYSADSYELLAHSEWVAKTITDWDWFLQDPKAFFRHPQQAVDRRMEALCNLLATMRLMMSNEPENGKPQ